MQPVRVRFDGRCSFPVSGWRAVVHPPALWARLRGAILAKGDAIDFEARLVDASAEAWSARLRLAPPRGESGGIFEGMCWSLSQCEEADSGSKEASRPTTSAEHRDAETLLHEALEGLVDGRRWTAGRVVLRDPWSGRLRTSSRLQTRAGPTSNDDVDESVVFASPTATVVDLRSSPESFPALAASPGVGCWAAVPVRLAGQLVAGFELFGPEGEGVPDPAELDALAEALAGELAKLELSLIAEDLHRETRLVIDSSQVPLAVLSGRGRVLLRNRAFEALCSADPPRQEGDPVWPLLDAPGRLALRRELESGAERARVPLVVNGARFVGLVDRMAQEPSCSVLRLIDPQLVAARGRLPARPWELLWGAVELSCRTTELDEGRLVELVVHLLHQEFGEGAFVRVRLGGVECRAEGGQEGARVHHRVSILGQTGAVLGDVEAHVYRGADTATVVRRLRLASEILAGARGGR